MGNKTALDAWKEKYGVSSDNSNYDSGSNNTQQSGGSALDAWRAKYGVNNQSPAQSYASRYMTITGSPRNAGIASKYFNTFGWDKRNRTSNQKVALPSMNNWLNNNLTAAQRSVLKRSQEKGMYLITPQLINNIAIMTN